MTTLDSCKKFACKLQKCLQGLSNGGMILSDNVYQPSKCESIIEELRKCCINNYGNSVVCQGIDISKPYEHSTVDYKDVLK